MLSTDNEMVRDIVLAVMASLAKIERQKISERTRAGMERVRQYCSKAG
jgi:DNA invertase Pin-like site-specific DNA recombinase